MGGSKLRMPYEVPLVDVSRASCDCLNQTEYEMLLHIGKAALEPAFSHSPPLSLTKRQGCAADSITAWGVDCAGALPPAFSSSVTDRTAGSLRGVNYASWVEPLLARLSPSITHLTVGLGRPQYFSHAPHAARRWHPACLVKPIYWQQHHGRPTGSMLVKTTRATGESCSFVQPATISPVTNSWSTDKGLFPLWQLK